MSPARREAPLVLAACAVLFLTRLADVPFYTRGEPREGLVVREMLRTGAWLVPSRPDGELARKPPLYYWLAASMRSVLPGGEELLLRLPSAALGTAGVLATWATARAAVAPAAALPAALVLATSFEWTRAATQARIDMALVAPLALVLGAWMALLSDAGAARRRRLLVAATAGAALAVLAKGPVGLVVPALAAVALAAARRDPDLIRRLGAVPALAAAGAIAALWYAAALAEHGWAFYEVVARENWLRFLDSEDVRAGHGGKGLFYLPAVGLLGLLPWVPLLPLAVRRPRSEPLALAAAWALSVLVFFSIADAKRSVYLLPAFPAVALLVADGLAVPPDGGWRLALLRALTALWLPALAALAAAAAALASGLDVVAPLRPWLTPRDAAGAAAVVHAAEAARLPLLVLAVATAAWIPVLARLRRAARWRETTFAVAVAAVAWTAAFAGLVDPTIGRSQSLRGFMTTVDRRVPPDAILYAFFPLDPGLRFYAPRPLRPPGEADPARARLLLVWEDEHRRWRGSDGAELPTLAASRARSGGRGSLLLVTAPPGPLVQREAPRTPVPPRGPAADAAPGPKPAPGR